MQTINGSIVTFDGATMQVTFKSREYRTALQPVQFHGFGQYRTGYWTYTLTYSPATGSACNGVSSKEVTKDDAAFILGMTGGVKMHSVYAAMRKECNARDQYYAQERLHANGRGETDEIMGEMQ